MLCHIDRKGEIDQTVFILTNFDQYDGLADTIRDIRPYIFIFWKLHFLFFILEIGKIRYVCIRIGNINKNLKD